MSLASLFEYRRQLKKQSKLLEFLANVESLPQVVQYAIHDRLEEFSLSEGYNLAEFDKKVCIRWKSLFYIHFSCLSYRMCSLTLFSDHFSPEISVLLPPATAEQFLNVLRIHDTPLIFIKKKMPYLNRRSELLNGKPRPRAPPKKKSSASSSTSKGKPQPPKKRVVPPKEQRNITRRLLRKR